MEFINRANILRMRLHTMAQARGEIHEKKMIDNKKEGAGNKQKKGIRFWE